MSNRSINDFFMIWIYGGIALSIPLQIVLQGVVSFWANLKDWDEDKRWEVRSGLFTWNGGLVGLPVLVPGALLLGAGLVIFNGPGWLGRQIKSYLASKKKTAIPKRSYTGYPSSAVDPYRTAATPCNKCGSFSKRFSQSNLDRPDKPEPTTVPGSGVSLAPEELAIILKKIAES